LQVDSFNDSYISSDLAVGKSGGPDDTQTSLLVEDGDLVVRDSNGNKSITITGDGVIFFHKQGNEPSNFEIPNDGGAMYVSGGNPNPRWKKSNGRISRLNNR
jgi:hypothetical protein